MRERAGPELSPREQLLFEAGIKLGGIFHQYLGIPLTRRTAPALARAISEAVELQPYVVRARVTIDVARGGRAGRGRYAYHYLTPQMLRVRLTLADGRHRVEAELAYRSELRYPLMRVVGATPRARP